jgi:hypothetical protein
MRNYFRPVRNSTIGDMEADEALIVVAFVSALDGSIRSGLV